VLPAESVTLLVVAPEEFQVPTSTRIRSPAVTADPGVTASDPACPCADTPCTNEGLAADAFGTAVRLTAPIAARARAATANRWQAR
jgi:hypothetical protein